MAEDKKVKKEAIPQQYMGFWKDVFLKAMERWSNSSIAANYADDAVDRIRRKFEV